VILFDLQTVKKVFIALAIRKADSGLVNGRRIMPSWHRRRFVTVELDLAPRQSVRLCSNPLAPTDTRARRQVERLGGSIDA
jgi:hypothetical protein